MNDEYFRKRPLLHTSISFVYLLSPWTFAIPKDHEATVVTNQNLVCIAWLLSYCFHCARINFVIFRYTELTKTNNTEPFDHEFIHFSCNFIIKQQTAITPRLEQMPCKYRVCDNSILQLHENKNHFNGIVTKSADGLIT
jgi:hypothetical protein